MSYYPSEKQQEEMRQAYLNSLKTYKLDERIEEGQLYSSSYFLNLYKIFIAIIENDDVFVSYAVGFADFHDENDEWIYEKMIEELDLAGNYCKYDNWHDYAKDCEIKDLKRILREYHYDDSGDENELIERIIENDIPLEDQDIIECRLTDNGKKLFEYLEWIEIYDKWMDKFNFEDFWRYCNDKKGDIKEIAFDYLQLHADLAKEIGDEHILEACKSSKGSIEYWWKKDVEYKLPVSDCDAYEIFEGIVNYLDTHYRKKQEEEQASLERIQNSYMDEFNFCKLANDKYRLVPKERDCYSMPVKLKQYQYYKSVEEYNDADLALYDLAFVPWCFRQQLRDASFEEGFLTHNACKANWNDFSKDLNSKQLKKFLKKYGMNSSGSKEKLIERIAESNLPLEEFSSQKTFLTESAYELLEEYGWIEFYLDTLSHFDFLDYEDYMIDHDGNRQEVTLDYLDEHLKLADDALDFDYMMRCYDAKSKICHSIGNLDEALRCDMRILHLNMNPVCMERYRFPSHIPLVPENISNLKKLKLELGQEKIRESFDENWNFMGFESVIIPKDEVWSYLSVALNSPEQNRGSRKVREKYFMSL